MIISGAVIAQKLLADGVEIDDNVSCELPSIESETGEIKGAGILGPISLPVTGQIGSLTFKVNVRAINKNVASLAKPGKQNLELRFVRDVIAANGNMVPVGAKIFLTAVSKKHDSGKVENNSTMDGSVEFEVIRYRQVIDGVETLLIDKQNSIYKINGVDYMQQVTALL